MSDLEARIAAWRLELGSGASALRDDELDELESHLREAVDELVRAGHDPAIAFGLASQRLGRPGELQAEFDKTNVLRAFRYRLFWIAVGFAMVAVRVPWTAFHDFPTTFVYESGARGGAAWLLLALGLVPDAPIQVLAAWIVLRVSGLLPLRSERAVPFSRLLWLIGCCAVSVAATMLAWRGAVPTTSFLPPGHDARAYYELAQATYWLREGLYAVSGAALMFWAAAGRSELRRRVYWIAAGFMLFRILAGASGVSQHAAAALLGIGQLEGPIAQLAAIFLSLIAWCGALALLAGPLAVAARTHATRSVGLRGLGVAILAVLYVAFPEFSLRSQWAQPARLEVEQLSSIVNMVVFWSSFAAALILSRRFAAGPLDEKAAER
jgi:hypothetical protein